MQCTVQLGPDGNLQFRTPNGRLLTIPFDLARTEEPWPDPDNDLAEIWRKRALTAEAAFRILHKMLSHAEEHEQAPMSYPTQHVLDALARNKKVDWSQREPVVVRTVIGDAPRPVRRKSKPGLKTFGHEKKVKIDLSKVVFKI